MTFRFHRPIIKDVFHVRQCLIKNWQFCLKLFLFFLHISDQDKEKRNKHFDFFFKPQYPSHDTHKNVAGADCKYSWYS